MLKLDPIIAVNDLEASSKWYQQLFGFKRIHRGNNFAVLTSKNDEIILCLHKWEEHQHPTLSDPGITPGNGLILYFRSEDINLLRHQAEQTGSVIADDIHLNANSGKMEFLIRDLDGYYLTITEYHVYEG